MGAHGQLPEPALQHGVASGGGLVSEQFFRLKAPCKDCPFRRDVHPYLRPARVQQILDSILRRDENFPCHKTIEVSDVDPADGDWDETFRPLKNDENEAFCAGALILLAKHKHPNRIPRVAQMLGWYDPELMKQTDVVFDSAQDMINAARKADQHG